MKHSNISCFLAIALLVGAGNTLADGMLVTAPEYYILETAQHALIKYDSDTNTETLSILPSFRGDTQEFAWVLPIPAQPQVEAGDAVLFRELGELTRPVHRYRDSDWDGCNRHDVDYLMGSPENGVDIIDSRMVGYYEIMTLAADEAPTLLASLTEWGFLHAGNIEQAAELITGYVEQGWYFVTVKVDSTAFAETFNHDYYYDYYHGSLEPLTFTFSSDEIIYPMRISALSAAESTQVSLYVLADHRMTFPGAATPYANRFTQEEIDGIVYHSTVKSMLRAGDFLTHLRKDFGVQDMAEDLTIVRADSDAEYVLIYYSGIPWMTIMILGPALLWGGYRKFFRRRSA